MNSQPTKKIKYTTLVLANKWVIIQRHKHDESAATLSSIYEITCPTIYNILKSLRNLKAENRVTQKKLKSGKFLKVEEALNAWFCQQRECHSYFR